ncbi:unnamed protein product [Eruca vesicaria subsp. sativa]|uniref:RRM domain-containing protein n=1 Tax=Eruca vesicaria subsp. sativa TaxID=29727 RepID=A0ABC8IRN8_ERUVS|nr:unnamed protein product [Eruca vesicaria subsp. sativa]
MASADVENCCVVTGLGPETDESSLKTAFSKYGEVIDAKITSDSDNGFPKGIVTFKDEKSMKDAIEGMSGQQLDDYTITVKDAGGDDDEGSYYIAVDGSRRKGRGSWVDGADYRVG